MRTKTLLCIGLSGFMGLLCLCGQGKKEETVYKPDSLSIETIRAFMCSDSARSDVARIRQVLFRYALVKRVLNRPVKVDSAAIRLARRLTLQSGKEWSPDAASLLLASAEALRTKVLSSKSAAPVVAYVESVSTLIETPAPGRPEEGSALRSDFAGLDTLDINDAGFFSRIASPVFGISPEEAVTLASFVGDELQTTIKTTPADIEKMVRGAFSKPAPEETVSAGKESAPSEQDKEKSANALRALSHRPQKSIRDSIARRLPDLEVIYRKQLKLNEMSGGIVWVVFQVGVDGRVISATIKSSDIANKKFQQLLTEYVRTIRFKAVPEDVGPMTFEFPFEFKSEG